MDKHRPVRDQKEWEELKAKIKSTASWLCLDRDPESFPAIVVIYRKWNQRYGETSTRYDSDLLRKMHERYIQETEQEQSGDD